MGSVAGNQAADDAIQALGGYGYTKEYMVEKIKRDVRITTIYEGTSEILEMTIARDRWQQHLKSRGAFFHDQGAELLRLADIAPGSGAEIAALAAHGLAEIMEHARVHRLTRNQHVLFRLGEIVAYAECAGALARRSAAATAGELAEKADTRFDPETLACISRVFAREAAAKVALDGTRWVIGSAEPGAIDPSGFEAAVGTKAIREAQSGLIADMDAVADALYNRS
jgi:alkylation response protein AidB-like acyl-CoA dehydrogenase